MNKQRVLITGAKGQLGSELTKLLKSQNYAVYGFGREELDVTDIDNVKKTFNQVMPDIVIHTAAFTKVDEAESFMDKAFLVNSFGTRNIAVISQSICAKLVYISTDYVFDGTSKVPYNEFDLTNPMNIYGKSKVEGEHFVQNLHSKYFIVRTSWVYGDEGNNFVKTMIQLAKEGKEIKVVKDQIGCPTYAVDLAECISSLIRTEKFGIYHVSNSGHCSWYEFASAIFNELNYEIKLSPCVTSDFPRPAHRPGLSILDHTALRINGFKSMRHWQEALREFLGS